MLARRLLLLCGVLIGVGGLYLREIETDASLVRVIGGSGLPSIWQSFSTVERFGIVIGVGLLVGLAYRPRLPPMWDRVAAVAGGLLAGAAMVMLLFAYRDARGAAADLRELLDLAVFSDLISESPGAAAGWGFLVSFGGLGVVGAASLWDLFGPHPALRTRPAARTPGPGARPAKRPPAKAPQVAGQSKGGSTRQPPRASAPARTGPRRPAAGGAASGRPAGSSGPPQPRGGASKPGPPPSKPPSVGEANDPPAEGVDPDD